jgi:Co/Zn/Cd efflux system component
MANCCEEVKKPDECCETTNEEHGWDCRYRQILWAILLINAVMFFVEIASGI